MNDAENNTNEIELSPWYRVFATLYDTLLLCIIVLLYITMYTCEVASALFRCLMLCAEKALTVVREQKTTPNLAPKNENSDA